MFVLKSLGKLILGNSEQKELLKLQSGTLWKVDLDPEDSSKIISKTMVFSDEEESATLILRRGSVPFSYELVVLIIDSAGFENQVGPFKLRQDSSFTLRTLADSAETLFYWNEPDGKEPNSVWEFKVSNAKTSPSTIEMFQMTVAQCIYEFEMKRSQNSASDEDIKKYLLTESGVGGQTQNEPIKSKIMSNSELIDRTRNLPNKDSIIIESEEASFHLFDSSNGLFALKHPQVTAFIVRNSPNKPWEYSFQIYSNEPGESRNLIHSQLIDPDATQCLDKPTFSFIWCHFASNGMIWTFSLKFGSLQNLISFANVYNQSVYETLNHEKWSKVTENDAKYLLNPLLDVEMTQALPLEFESDEESDSSESDSSEEEKLVGSSSEPRTSMFQSRKQKNQILSIGYKSDRSFVARGDSIGVFKPGQDGLDLVTEAKVKYPNSSTTSEFKISKMMLHQGDESLLLMNPDAPNSVFKMDLERGEVIEEWKVHEDSKVTSILPNSKYSQMTGESTFIGLNSNSIFRIDPRLSGTKRVESEMKSYAVKNEFSCGATTGTGELAVASSKGELRLFNKLDKRAKTLLPMFGDPILGVDSTENGKFIIATCKTYLLLINTELSDGSGATGFTKSMGGADDKPIPKRLQLKPEHIAYMGSSPSFTPARFSTGQSEERSIITSSGPYVITWNLRRVKQGHLYDYQIKKYEDTVVADNFRYGQDRSIVVTLPENVTLISKKSLSCPSPKSLRSNQIVHEY